MDSLRGQLLVAGPSLVDPNFRRTVVLVGEHNEEGALGVVLNRPTELSVEDVVPPLSALTGDGARVFIGGPVRPSDAVVLVEFDDPGKADLPVLGGIGFLIGDIDPGSLVGLRRARVFAGYAGWGPGQLEGELEESSWIVEGALPADVFDEDPEELWSSVLRRKGGDYLLISTMPFDPSRN